MCCLLAATKYMSQLGRPSLKTRQAGNSKETNAVCAEICDCDGRGRQQRREKRPQLLTAAGLGTPSPTCGNSLLAATPLLTADCCLLPAPAACQPCCLPPDAACCLPPAAACCLPPAACRCRPPVVRAAAALLVLSCSTGAPVACHCPTVSHCPCFCGLLVYSSFYVNKFGF